MAYADYVQAVDRISGFLNQPINQTRNISLFETPIVYDRQFRRSRLGIQYRPRLAFLDGKVIGDFVNQDLSFETYYLLSPRWTLRISDRFQYSSSKSSLAALHLDFDVISGSTVQNAFVDVPSRWFSNSVGGTVSYRWSARTEISFVPQYAYVDTRVESAGNRGNIYSADIDVDHQLSARQSVGLYYTTQFIRLTSNEDSPSVYQGLGGSYRWRIRPSLSFRGSFGALTSTFGGSGSREWTVSSNLRLIKSFRKSSIAVTYVRGDSFTSGYVSDRYNDRVDASFRTTLTKRLDIGFGGGYLRELSRTGISAKYVGSRLTYLLYPNILLVVNYAHKNQSGDGVDVFRGTRDIFSFGLSWQPATPR